MGFAAAFAAGWTVGWVRSTNPSARSVRVPARRAGFPSAVKSVWYAKKEQRKTARLKGIFEMGARGRVADNHSASCFGSSLCTYSCANTRVERGWMGSTSAGLSCSIITFTFRLG